MVNLFRVMMSGRTVSIAGEDGAMECGFTKTVYVIACSEAAAVSSARSKVLGGLRKRPGVTMPNAGELELVVDDVDRETRIWKLVANESFIFFPAHTWEP
jgi:hypothetical protein